MAVAADSAKRNALQTVIKHHFCRTHGKQSDAGSLSHGRVDGDIPEPKYEEFVRESQSARFKK